MIRGVRTQAPVPHRRDEHDNIMTLATPKTPPLIVPAGRNLRPGQPPPGAMRHAPPARQGRATRRVEEDVRPATVRQRPRGARRLPSGAVQAQPQHPLPAPRTIQPIGRQAPVEVRCVAVRRSGGTGEDLQPLAAHADAPDGTADGGRSRIASRGAGRTPPHRRPTRTPDSPRRAPVMRPAGGHVSDLVTPSGSRVTSPGAGRTPLYRQRQPSQMPPQQRDSRIPRGTHR